MKRYDIAAIGELNVDVILNQIDFMKLDAVSICPYSNIVDRAGAT